MDVELLVVPDCPNESAAMEVMWSTFERAGVIGEDM
jgi:hypothetical protein